jgi:hypothetical protein
MTDDHSCGGGVVLGRGGRRPISRVGRWHPPSSPSSSSPTSRHFFTLSRTPTFIKYAYGYSADRSTDTGPPMPRHAEHWHIQHKSATNMGRSTALLLVNGHFTACCFFSKRNHRHDRLTDSDSCRIISRSGTPPSGQHPRIWPERSQGSIRSCFSHRSVLSCRARTHECMRRRAVNKLWEIEFYLDSPVPRQIAITAKVGKLRADDGRWIAVISIDTTNHDIFVCIHASTGSSI